MDIADVEKAERQIDQFIEKCAREKADANKVEELFAASERKHRERRHRENAAAWREYHNRTADDLERTAAQLAAEHRAKAEALFEGGDAVA